MPIQPSSKVPPPPRLSQKGVPRGGSLLSGGTAAGASNMAVGGVDSLMVAGSLMAPTGDMLTVAPMASAKEPVGLLAWGSDNKLYQFLVDDTAWSEFPTQPSVAAGAHGSFCVSFSDGTIYLSDQPGSQIKVYNADDDAWSAFSVARPAWHAGAVAGTADFVAVNNIGYVATYEGATGTFTEILDLGAGVFDVAEEGTLDDIWVLANGAGGEIRHWDGASWTTHRAAMIAQLGVDPGPSGKITRYGDKLYLTFASGGWPLLGRCVRYNITTDTWSFVYSDYWTGAWGVWATDGHVYMRGYDWAGNPGGVLAWDEATWTQPLAWNGTQTGSNYSKGIWGNELMIAADGFWATNECYISIDQGASFTRRALPVAGGVQFATLYG